MGANDMPPVAKHMQVDLVMTPDLALELQRQTTALELAQAYKIEGSMDEQKSIADEANGHLRSVKGAITTLKEKKSKFVEPAKRIIGEAEALFNPAIASLEQAERYLKTELSGYLQREQERIEDARRAAQREEQERRQKADREAAVARARAEEEARQKRVAAEEAEKRRIEAEAAGDGAAAKKAAADKARADADAIAAVEKGETKAQQVELTAAAAAPSVVVPEDTKLSGFSARENYVAELAMGCTEESALALVVSAIAGVPVDKLARPDLLALTKIDWPSANRLAKAQKKSMHVPGLAAINRPVAASRGK